MKKIIALLLPVLLFILAAPAQTKRIAMLSHSGKIASINIKSEGNFGETPEMLQRARLDWDSAFRADSIRYDSISRSQHRPMADTGVKQINSGKLQPMAPQKEPPRKAGTWLEKSKR
jgi:hypothetical protein